MLLPPPQPFARAVRSATATAAAAAHAPAAHARASIKPDFRRRPRRRRRRSLALCNHSQLSGAGARTPPPLSNIPPPSLFLLLFVVLFCSPPSLREIACHLRNCPRRQHPDPSPRVYTCIFSPFLSTPPNLSHFFTRNPLFLSICRARPARNTRA